MNLNFFLFSVVGRLLAVNIRIILVIIQMNDLSEKREEVRNMLVVRTDNHYDYVNDFMLDSMIKSKEIVKFKHNTEWVNVGKAPIRSIKQDIVFNGNNRLAINDLIFVRADRRDNK
jgi:hypothetical protein